MSGKHSFVDGRMKIIFVKSQQIDQNTIESRKLFNKYLKQVSELISEKEYELTLKQLEICGAELVENEELINLFELYNYFEAEIQGMVEKTVDDSELQMVSDVICFYRDSVDKIDIDYLLAPSEGYTVTIDSYTPHLDSVNSEEIIIDNF
ncbi:MAG: hypothetical protein PHE56_01205 [Bacteroidales bacterium]|nr:hypothetical protein [Bacteroidales bacterium]